MSVLDQPRSVSQTEQYEKCAWQWYLKRVERVEARPAAWSHHGTAFHSAAEALELGGRRMSPDEAVTVFAEQYSELTNRAMKKQPELDTWLAAGRSPVEDIEHRYVLGRAQTRHYVTWAQKKGPSIWKTPDGKLGVELEFHVELGGVQVRGFIDQVVELSSGAVRPRDLKTGSTKSRFQLETYGVATAMLYDVEVTDADWYLAKEGRLSRPVKLDKTTADRLGERYAAMDAGVKAGRFPASPGFHCRFCDVSHACSFAS